MVWVMGQVTGQHFLLRVKNSSSSCVFSGSGRVRKFWPVLPCLATISSQPLRHST